MGGGFSTIATCSLVTFPFMAFRYLADNFFAESGIVEIMRSRVRMNMCAVAVFA